MPVSKGSKADTKKVFSVITAFNIGAAKRKGSSLRCSVSFKNYIFRTVIRQNSRHIHFFII